MAVLQQQSADSLVAGGAAASVGSDARLKRLALTLTAGNVALYVLWIGAGAFLLPNQVQRITGTTDATALGLASTLGAIFATVGNPVFGQLSDRTRSRYGRRAPWIVGCAVAGGVLLCAQAAAGSILLLGVSWAVVQLLFNGYQAAITAVMPDRVPDERYGLFSGLLALGVPLGTTVAAVLFLSFPGLADGDAYYLIAALVVGAALLVAFGSPDDSSESLASVPFDLRAFLKNFWVSPKQHPDFAWAFLARLFVVLGYFVVFTFNNFILQNYLHLSKDDANKGVGQLMLVNALATVCVAVVAGRLADRLGRYKLFVMCSGIGAGLALLIPLLMPSMGGMMLFNLAQGLAFGTYMAVDMALITKVLPNKDDVAKDMGVINIANAGPQILAPAIAAAVVGVSGYHALFVTGAVFAVLGSVMVLKIRGVR